MNEAVRARDACREAVRDITPVHLRDAILQLVDDATMVPGGLTYASANAVDRPRSPGDLDERAAGVQLIYEGLRLTRSLARENPWRTDDTPAEHNIDILAADVMVSRGFSLLARTDAADDAVATVRNFGANETRNDDTTSRTLEADIAELAIVAGTTAAGIQPPARLREYASELTTTFDTGLTQPITDTLAKLTAPPKPRTHDEPLRQPSATDP